MTEARISKGHRKVIHLFRIQGGLCSLCAGRMELVNFNALPKKFVRDLRANDPARFSLIASLDHTLPLSGFRGIENNTRAAHIGCNEAKHSQLVEPFPLPCFELPSIKLPSGQRAPMRSLEIPLKLLAYHP